jgi:hypothetical protein
MHSHIVTRQQHKPQRTSDPLNRPIQKSSGMLAISGGGQEPRALRRMEHLVSQPRHLHACLPLLCNRLFRKEQKRPHCPQRT